MSHTLAKERGYTTNAIESLHSQVRKSVHGRGHFQSDKAPMKLMARITQLSAGWTRPPIAWQAGKAQFALQFEERFVIGGE